MHFFKQRLDRYEELIKQGDLKGAIKRMEGYDIELVQMGSNVGKLIDTVRVINVSMKLAETLNLRT